MSLPVLDDTQRAAGLRRMKMVATGLLVVLAVIFVISFALQERYPWLQYVRAAAEGGMVGALADWFAVTALFKHPMGVKIPHTAIIPRKKDQIGASLGQFVESNFLSEEVITQKLGSMQLAQKAGAWLERPESAARVATEGSAAIRGILRVLDDDAVKTVLESMFRRHVVDPPWGPPMGRVAERVFEEGHHHQLVNLVVDSINDWVEANPDVISELVAQRSPSWVPSFVDDLVGDRVQVEVGRFLRAVQEDQNHEMRRALDNYLKGLARDLQEDPAVMAKADAIKEQVLDDPRVQQLITQTWATIKNALTTAVDDPDSELTQNFKAAVQDFGHRLATDPELAAKVNTWIADAAGYLVKTYSSDIAGVITETVEHWDAQETSEKIELQVGKDLQFIRINGTVVGSLAGLAIFTVAHAVFG
ncbi:DUF445 domain-containing protein [Arthrobacter sunyaminii]|uniref:DUF445 domain-containing protein n=1 Tax=Arthrobacter sunyaminii TaxID=2816859 RepID=A0A975XKN9_9MICC|nr:DUF445 domain-containing protein [Arthrobacter sunyaminii]MBO0909269.1 DUF445 family protein [Arthrobacter sunyaminii]QWQ36397.1 DUF445 domain-containing protein [Arthrobacter sunyaminii]